VTLAAVVVAETVRGAAMAVGSVAAKEAARAPADPDSAAAVRRALSEHPEDADVDQLSKPALELAPLPGLSAACYLCPRARI
jgi:hypothetical protein